jgi:hypothetical protein
MLMKASFPVGAVPADLVPAADIAGALQTYPARNRFISEAWYSNKVLQAWGRGFPHPFHEPSITHLTREHALTYVSQASYILVSAAIERGDFPHLTSTRYSRACRNEEGLMGSVSVRFRRHAAVPDQVRIRAEILRIRKLRNAVFVDCEYEIADIAILRAWLTCPTD